MAQKMKSMLTQDLPKEREHCEADEKDKGTTEVKDTHQ